MTLQKLAGKRLLEGGAAVVMALLLAAPAVAMPDQSRQRPHDSGGDSGRTAAPRSMDSSPSGSSGSSARSADGGEGSRGSNEPRTAQPSPGGGGDRSPSRQPPHDRGRDGRGSHGGYYRPWYGWGGGWWGWGSWWYDGPYYGPGGYPYYHPGGGPYYDDDMLGALDLDVAPGRTQVYLDGRYIGTVDAYDGFPRYLWLERGTYDLVFYLDGYKTVARQISVYPGTVIDLDDRMEEGESIKPEDLPTKTHDRRDARIRDEGERRDDRGRDDGDWRDRVREERERRHDGDQWRDRDRGRDEDGEVGDDDDNGNGRGDERRHGQLQLDVEPGDASVYLDGRFVGTADELDRGLSVNPGKHQIAVVRPGRASREVEVEVSAGQQVELDIELEDAP